MLTLLNGNAINRVTRSSDLIYTDVESTYSNAFEFTIADVIRLIWNVFQTDGSSGVGYNKAREDAGSTTRGGVPGGSSVYREAIDELRSVPDVQSCGSWIRDRDADLHSRDND